MKRILMALMLMPMMALAGNDLYMVVDLSGGASASSYPISYLADVPEGGWTDEYKTTKLVLRRIEPGTCVVTTDKPYYIGVFEVTQKQYELITGTTPSYFSGNDMCPVECVSYDMLRGNNKGAQYPDSTEVNDESVIGKLRSRTAIQFDLPTEAQWEYACRAGTTTAYSYGDSVNGDYMWYWNNTQGRNANDVGTRKSNAWGLYDMHGNVYEWCLNPYNNSKWFRILRGGSFGDEHEDCTSSSRDHASSSNDVEEHYGFRLVANIDPLSDGLVAWYKFDGDTQDSSGNAYDQHVSGTTSYTEDRHGAANSAFMLDGATALHEYETGNAIVYGSNYTFSCWFKATEATELKDVTTSGIRGFSSSIKYLVGATELPIAVGTNGINVFEHGNYFLPASFKYESAIGTDWHHLTMTVSDDEDIVVYLDGKVIGNIKKYQHDCAAWISLGHYDGNESRYVGVGAFSYGGRFKGGIDDVRFYNRVLSADEAKALYDSEKPSLPDGLVAWYKFDGDAKDSSGNGHDCDVHGATLTMDRFGNQNNAYYFNGQSQYLKCEDGTDVTNSFSISLWFKTSVTLSSHGSSSSAWNPGNYIYFPRHGGNGAGYGFKVGTDGIQVTEHGYNYLPTVLDYKASIGTEWNHVVVTLADNGNPNLYLNGKYVMTGSGSSRTKWIGVVEGIGGGIWGYYTGCADDVRIYNRALSAVEIKSLYEYKEDRVVWDVTFNATGGVASWDTMSVTSNTAIGELPTAERDGHKFLGWCSEIEGGTQVTPETIITTNVTFYAHWFDTSIGNVTGATNMLWRTGGDAVWATEEADDGWDVRSGAIGKNSETWIECVVTNGCRVSYDWKVSCEPGEGEEMYDYLSLKVDGNQVDAICGESGWTNGTAFVTGEGEHILRWTYQKDYRTSEGEDCGWLGKVKVDLKVAVTFEGNGATSGEVPTIATAYLGDTIVIPGTGTLAKRCHAFGGWQCEGKIYFEGESLTVAKDAMSFAAVWEAKVLGAVTLQTPETLHVTTEKIGISFNMPANATTIRYTLDGSEPTIQSAVYVGPFEVADRSVTVKAIACADDWFESVCATWELTRAPWSAPECLNVETRSFTFGGNAGWVRDLDVTHDGEAAMRSGAIGDKQKSLISMPVNGAGSVSFWCKVSSECDPDDGTVYDGLAVLVDGEEVYDDLIGGEVDWTNITVEVAGEGGHTIGWRYEKDKTGKSGDDCAWLDEILWQADKAVVMMSAKGEKDIVIGREWIERDLVDRYGAGRTEAFRNKYGTDYDLAVRKLSGKTFNGKPASVWQDYVAGTDPTDTNSVFASSIEIVGGVPIVTWKPDLKSERTYKIWGSTNLVNSTDWHCPTNALDRFLKVTVEMK